MLALFGVGSLRSGTQELNSFEHFWQAYSQALANLLNIHQRNVPNSPLNAAIVRAVEPASFGSLLLINPLLLTNATDSAAKTDADVERHRLPSWGLVAYTYTSDESHCC